MKPIHQQRLRLWAEILRSGKYQQAKGRLRRGNSYCCLGVACDIYRKETGKGQWDSAFRFQIGNLKGCSFLPFNVKEWFGLKHACDMELLSCNDFDRKRSNLSGIGFPEIAQLIDEIADGA